MNSEIEKGEFLLGGGNCHRDVISKTEMTFLVFTDFKSDQKL